MGYPAQLAHGLAHDSVVGSHGKGSGHPLLHRQDV